MAVKVATPTRAERSPSLTVFQNDRRISPRDNAFPQCSVVQGAGRLNTPNSFMNVPMSRQANGTTVINATRTATSQNAGQRQRPRSNPRLLNLPEMDACA